MTETKRPLWIELWDLSTDMVSCTECHRAQHMSLRNLAFVHSDNCTRKGAGQFPYVELLEMLKLLDLADQPLPSNCEVPWSPPKD